MSIPVYEKLRELILSSSELSDDMLVERNLAERLGVSRTPIREALRRLEQDGLLERIGRRLHVATRSPDQILEIYEARITLEAAAARGAARRRTDLDLSRLVAIHEEMRRLEPSDHEARMLLNRRFHECLWNASYNSALVDVLTRLVMHLRRDRQSTVSLPGRREHILEAHEQLIAAIREHRADDAERIAAEHMTAARDARLRVYAQATTGAVAAPALNPAHPTENGVGEELPRDRSKEHP